MKDLLFRIETVVKEAGDRLLSSGTGTVHEKEGIGNYVTDRDLQTQRFLYERLSLLLPDAAFVGEEDEAMKTPPGKGYCFVIDPIDGTANFIRGANYSSVSVGLLKDGLPVLGVVLNPFTKELYSAEKGAGAFLNGTPIRVSDIPLKDGVAVVGFSSYDRGEGSSQFSRYSSLFDHCADLRCLGSAALDICGVACGRWEVFTEPVLKPWDYAAGMLILTEAGGILTQTDGTPVSFTGKHSVLAASETCYEESLRILNR